MNKKYIYFAFAIIASIQQQNFGKFSFTSISLKQGIIASLSSLLISTLICDRVIRKRTSFLLHRDIDQETKRQISIGTGALIELASSRKTKPSSQEKNSLSDNNLTYCNPETFIAIHNNILDLLYESPFYNKNNSPTPNNIYPAGALCTDSLIGFMKKKFSINPFELYKVNSFLKKWDKFIFEYAKMIVDAIKNNQNNDEISNKSNETDQKDKTSNTLDKKKSLEESKSNENANHATFEFKEIEIIEPAMKYGISNFLSNEQDPLEKSKNNKNITDEHDIFEFKGEEKIQNSSKNSIFQNIAIKLEFNALNFKQKFAQYKKEYTSYLELLSNNQKSDSNNLNKSENLEDAHNKKQAEDTITTAENSWYQYEKSIVLLQELTCCFMNLYSDKNYVNVSREYYNFIKKCLIPEEKRNFLQDSDIVEPGKDSQNNSYYTPLMIAQDLLVKVTKLYRENIVPELLIDQHPLWIKQVDMLEKMITALSKQNYDADYDNVSGRVPDNQIFFE